MRAPVLFRYVLVGIVLFILLVSLPKRMFYCIAPGHCGILVSKVSGIQREKILAPGLKMVMPWHQVVIYDVRLQADTQRISAMAKNGVPVTCVLSYFFQPDKDKLTNLNDEITDNYKDNIIIPEIKAAVWKVLGKYQPEELYSSKRDTLQQELLQLTSDALKKKYIVVDRILVKEIILPPSLQRAIEESAVRKMSEPVIASDGQLQNETK